MKAKWTFVVALIFAVILWIYPAGGPVFAEGPAISLQNTGQGTASIVIEKVGTQGQSTFVLFRVLDYEGKFVKGIQPQNITISISGRQVNDFAMTALSKRYLISWANVVEIELRQPERSLATATPLPTATATTAPLPPTATPVRLSAVVKEEEKPKSWTDSCTIIPGLALIASLIAGVMALVFIIKSPSPSPAKEEIPEAALKVVRKCRTENRRVKVDDLFEALKPLGYHRETVSRLWYQLVAEGWIAGNAWPTAKAGAIPKRNQQP